MDFAISPPLWPVASYCSLRDIAVSWGHATEGTCQTIISVGSRWPPICLYMNLLVPASTTLKPLGWRSICFLISFLLFIVPIGFCVWLLSSLFFFCFCYILINFPTLKIFSSVNDLVVATLDWTFTNQSNNRLQTMIGLHYPIFWNLPNAL